MWDIDFISEDDFRAHVSNTIEEYKRALRSAVDLKEFNKNIIDPIKFVFDKALYGASWQEMIAREIVRQKDKTINNSIGYFHQKIFQYIHRDGCTIVVPENGMAVFSDHGGKAGWDIAFENEDGIFIDDRTSVRRIYAEMKNKHNTMNSSGATRTHGKMQRQIVDDDDCACFLVEVIAKESQNESWVVARNINNANKRIRRASIDEFYGIVTGESDAFMKICMKLPDAIQDIIRESPINPNELIQDTVYAELERLVPYRDNDENARMIRAMYTLAFSTYKGF